VLVVWHIPSRVTVRTAELSFDLIIKVMDLNIRRHTDEESHP